MSTLVDCRWLADRLDDPNLCLIEIAGNGQEQLQAYKAGHVPGAHPWRWKEWLWDDTVRDFPSPALFAERMGRAGIGNDTTVVLYGEDVQFGIYAWWVFCMCGHANVRLLDGARYRWKEERRALVSELPAPRAPVRYRPVARRDDASRILRDELLTPFKTLHGGVMAGLVDHVLGCVLYPLMPRGQWAATTEFKLNYLAPVFGGVTLRAESTVVSLGRRTAVVQVEVSSGDQLVCVAQGTLLVSEPAKKTS